MSWSINDHAILKKIHFHVFENEFVGIVGPNGAGKSSLLGSLYRKILPDEGEIILFNKNINHFTRRELAQVVAVVLQEPPQQFELKVKDVIGIGLTPHKSLFSFDTIKDEQLIFNAAQHVDIEHKLSLPFNSLSGGEKQRVMIARAIIQKPKILIMDEPTNHLDIQHQIEVLQLVKHLNITVILSIHDLNLAAAFCDRLLLLDQGHCVDDGTVSEVLTETNLRQVFKVKAHVHSHPFHSCTELSFDYGERQ